MLLFFSVARSPDIGQGERAVEAQEDDKQREVKRETKPAKLPAGIISVQLPPMSSAFDTAGWPVAA